MASTKVSMQQQKMKRKGAEKTCSLRGREKITNENMILKNK
jgi:hypothetical protein